MMITKEVWLNLLTDMIDRHNWKEYSGVFGVPRGGTLISLYINLMTDIPLLTAPIANCLVVDDLIDSGKTREKYEDYDFDTLIEKEGTEWIDFWYEKKGDDIKTLLTRLIEFIEGESNLDTREYRTLKKIMKV